DKRKWCRRSCTRLGSPTRGIVSREGSRNHQGQLLALDSRTSRAPSYVCMASGICRLQRKRVKCRWRVGVHHEPAGTSSENHVSGGTHCFVKAFPNRIRREIPVEMNLSPLKGLIRSN